LKERMKPATGSDDSDNSRDAQEMPSLVQGRLLARNAVLNLAGYVVPLVVALFTVPILVRGLGVDRLGVLTLTWAAIGYFSLFDLGLGRALTQRVSAALGGGRREELAGLTGTALAAMALLGVAGGIVLAALTPWLVSRVLEVPPSLRAETVTAFYLLCVSLPFVLLTAGLRSVFEAHQEFAIATVLRLPYAVFNFVAPVCVLPFSRELGPVVGVLVVGRIATCAAHWIVARRRYSFVTMRRRSEFVLPLLRTGGWMTVSNVVSPLMVNFDRFVIAAILPVSAVAYYAAPYDVVMKLLVVPGALLGVFFPAFAATFATDRAATSVLLDRMLRCVLLLMFPAALVLVAFAREGLGIWIGHDFAAQSTAVVQWLAVGVLINSLGQVAFAAAQAMGRADVTARLHLIELPIYGVMLVTTIRFFGITGVAIAWTVRVAVDTVALFVFSARSFGEVGRVMIRTMCIAGALVAMLGVVAAIDALSLRASVAALVLAVFIAAVPLILLSRTERETLTKLVSFSS
ncbi:MAG TPA: flippase, partial [Gemmatimonadaceae bacterium]